MFMTIGKLNGLLPGITYGATFENSARIPNAEEKGNPLCGEILSYKWEELRDTGVEFHIALGMSAFVDRVVLHVSEKTNLSEVLLTSYGKRLSAYRAETGKAITEKVLELEAGLVTDGLTLLVRGDFSNIEILSIDLYGAVGEEDMLFPTPNAAELGDSYVPHAHFSSYTADSEDGKRAGAILSEKFAELTAERLTEQECGTIRFVTDAALSANAYSVTVSNEKTELRASDLRGFVMAAECFIKLTDERGVRTAEVSDAPAYPFRGVHLYLPSMQNMEFARRLIKYLVSPMGYNAVIMEVATGMRYESHPEINDAVSEAMEKSRAGEWPPFPHAAVADGTVLEKSAIRAFVSYIRAFGIEVVPEVQSLGHVPYITLAHPEIAEVDEEMKNADLDTRLEDARPNVFYPHCYCPSNDRSYEILFDLLDEVIEVFEPREYVHMGHDEVYYMGVCPLCKGKSHADLFASDVSRIHAHLKEKGLKMMMWADMLQPVTKYQTPAAIDRIPRDILMLDFIWYFHLGKDIEDNLLGEGFKVAVGNLYSSHFPRYESRIRKEGMVGGQISAWACTSEEGLQREGKLYDLLYTAQMLWADGYSHLYRLVYERTISELMPALRERIKGVKYPSRAHGTRRTLLCENTIGEASATAAFSVSELCDSIVLIHAMTARRMRLPWTKHDEVGRYRLTYTDGSEELLSVTAYGNIGYIGRRQYEPLAPKLYRHNGYAAVYESDGVTEYGADGTPLTFYRWEYILPKGKRLSSVVLEEDSNFDARIFLRRAEGFSV